MKKPIKVLVNPDKTAEKKKAIIDATMLAKGYKVKDYEINGTTAKVIVK